MDMYIHALLGDLYAEQAQTARLTEAARQATPPQRPQQQATPLPRLPQQRAAPLPRLPCEDMPLLGLRQGKRQRLEVSRGARQPALRQRRSKRTRIEQ
jgi:hypothetical protein